MSFWWDGNGMRYLFREVIKAIIIMTLGLPVLLFLIYLFLMLILQAG